MAIFLKKYILLFTLFILSFQCAVSAQSLGNKEKIVLRKNYPFLYFLSQEKSLQQFLTKDAIYTSIVANTKNRIIQLNASSYTENNFALFDALKLSEIDIEKWAQSLSGLLKNNSIVRTWLQNNKLLYGLSNEDVTTNIKTCFVKDIQGINYVIDVYGEGKKPNYPNIDSISIDISKPNNRVIFQKLFWNVAQSNFEKSAFFSEGYLRAASSLLELNGRNNAADFEPLESTENQSALVNAAKMNWKNFPYSHILVLGAGPEIKEDSLNPLGILRCRLTAQLYENKQAPFIIVSGGRVHPYKTNFSEALEMKKYLINELNIPANAIVIEPHARHTTTNIRNCARLLFKYHFPVKQAGLIVTTEEQSAWLTEDNFAKRCQEEMGMVPYENVKRLSNTLVSYLPVNTAFLVNNKEPLDP